MCNSKSSKLTISPDSCFFDILVAFFCKCCLSISRYKDIRFLKSHLEAVSDQFLLILMCLAIVKMVELNYVEFLWPQVMFITLRSVKSHSELRVLEAYWV